MAFRSEELALRERISALQEENRALGAANEELATRLDRWRHRGEEEESAELGSALTRIWRALLATPAVAIIVAATVGGVAGLGGLGEPDLSLNGVRNLIWMLRHDAGSLLALALMAAAGVAAVFACLAAPTVAMGVRSRSGWSYRATWLVCLGLFFVPTVWPVWADLLRLRRAGAVWSPPRVRRPGSER